MIQQNAVHSNGRPLPCENVSKSFKRTTNLKECHALRRKDKSHDCLLCKRSSDINQQKQMHSIRPFIPEMVNNPNHKDEYISDDREFVECKTSMKTTSKSVENKATQTEVFKLENKQLSNSTRNENKVFIFWKNKTELNPSTKEEIDCKRKSIVDSHSGTKSNSSSIRLVIIPVQLVQEGPKGLGRLCDAEGTRKGSKNETQIDVGVKRPTCTPSISTKVLVLNAKKLEKSGTIEEIQCKDRTEKKKCLTDGSDPAGHTDNQSKKLVGTGSDLKNELASNRKNFKCCCETCGKFFRKKIELQRHSRRHSDKRPFECKECGKRFKAKSHLKVHWLVHTRERPFNCNMCASSFFRSRDLQLHTEADHLKVTAFRCIKCECIFETYLKLHRHKQQFGKKKLHSQCGQCSNCIKDSSYVNIPRFQNVLTPT